MAQTIIIKNGTGSISNSDIVKGELAINTDSGSLYYGNTAGNVGNDFTFGDVTASKFVGDGSGITGVTADWDGTFTGDAIFTGDVTASGNISASGTITANNFIGNGSSLTSLPSQTENDFTTVLKNKLDAVEASADVTDTTNVTAAGALMDSELAGIAAVKATTGTFLSADETKLDGIEASADVTDTTNVTAAGALMDSEVTSITDIKAINQGLTTTSNVQFGHVTASGNVSASGRIYADGAIIDGNMFAETIGIRNISTGADEDFTFEITAPGARSAGYLELSNGTNTWRFNADTYS